MAVTIPVPTLASETLVTLGPLPLRNTLLMAWLAMAVLIVLAVVGRMTGYRIVPGRFQVLLEMVVEGLHDFCDSILQSQKWTKVFFPAIATMFLFMLVGNWMGILPGVGSITVQGIHDGHEMAIPVFRSMNADVNMTLVFAILAIVAAQVTGVVALGILPHIGKYIVMPWKRPFVVGTFVGLLELIGEFARIVSFTFRLFGNIFAGEVLLVVVSVLVPYAVPIPFMGMELFVGLVQAVVFAMLTLVFLKLAMTSHAEGAH